MIVTDKFVFLHNPRTGGAYVRRILKQIFPPECFVPLEEWHTPVCNLNNDDFIKFKFGVIRNPWDWYVSLYHFQQPNGQWLRFTNSVGKNNTFKHFIITLLDDDFIYNNKDKLFHPVGNPYLKPCIPVFKYMNSLDVGFFTYRYIYMFFDKYEKIFLNKNLNIFKEHDAYLSLDKVIKKENLSKSLISLCVSNGFCENDKIQKITDKQKTKVNASKHDYYYKYYNTELIKLVEKKDKLIIDKYNYKFINK
jgi:hypothetical protein